MNIRLATLADLEAINAIYAYARKQMAQNGNPDQWGKNHPPLALIKQDIVKQVLYVLETPEHTLGGVFAFICGADPTYQKIEGQWANDRPYGVIHRIAGNGQIKGVFEKALAFCEAKCANLKIDTHPDNLIMQHLITKNGFQYCGIIYTDDQTKRLAYQKLKYSRCIESQKSDKEYHKARK